MAFYDQDQKQVLDQFKVSEEKGLTQNQVTDQYVRWGHNELQAKRGTNPIILFLVQFKSFIIYILFFAIIISIISGEFVDAIVILIILLFNAVFGFIQEFRAEKAIDALKKLAGLKVSVIRNGKTILLDTKELVPGDIILLEEGAKVPADARLLEAVRLQISEASLTGESVPVSKHTNKLGANLTIQDRKNMVFSGTVVTKGRGKAVVVATGMHTEIGHIADLLDEHNEETPLQKKLDTLGKWIGSITLLICFIVFVAGVFKEGLIPLLFEGEIVQFVFEAKEWFLVAISLAVAAVPEGLPAIVTIALALGVRKMVKRNALIRRLPSVETLGEATVICSDKTGTLTKNEMTVRVAYTNKKDLIVDGEGYSIQGTVSSINEKIQPHDTFLFQIGVLCNDATLDVSNKSIIGDPTEGALLVSAAKTNLLQQAFKGWKRQTEEPFDSTRKMMSTVNVDPKTKKAYVFTKGAPENVLEICTHISINGKISKLTAKQKKNILEKNERYASQALRVLGFAYKAFKQNEKLEQSLIFVGLQGMIDPPHSEVKDSIQECKEAGIRVIMITGDNRITAQAIAKEIGIQGDSMDGAAFVALSEAKQKQTVDTVNIFSRVEPEHKMRIVELLQQEGCVVAMTGDGVNDAPAIKKADLGISMGITGTDVAKESSDMVLQNDNFASIVSAVEEGRGIYENIRKFVNYLLSSNLAEVLIIFFAIVFGLPLPMTAIMLLWLNLVTDGLPALALSVDPNSKDLMKRKPKKATEGIINRSLGFNIVYVASLITIGILALFAWSMHQYSYLGETEQLMRIQTIAFTALIVMELVRLQAIRSEYHLSAFSNKYLVWAVIASLGLQVLVIYTPINAFFGTVPLSMLDWLYIIIVSAVVGMLNVFGNQIKNHLPWFKSE